MTNGEKFKEVFGFGADGSKVIAVNAIWWDCEFQDSKPFAKRIPAADVRRVVTCADCKYNNACLTQAFVEEESRVPFDRNTFFCSDGKRAGDREE